MKIGDSVRLTDHSYIVDLMQDGVLTDWKKAGGRHTGHCLRVVAVCCDLPVFYDHMLIYSGPDNWRNDVILFDEDTQTYLFANSKLLVPACQYCGR